MLGNSRVTVIPPKPRFTHRVGIYCRVSTRSQEQLDSLANQVSFLTRIVATKLGWQLMDIYLDVKSGSDAASRSEFQRLLRDCQANKLDIVLTKSVSRFGRNTAETLAAINEIRGYQVEVIFDQEELSTNDPNAQLLISILEGVAQEENEARSKNIRWGIMRKVENGTSSIFNRKCYGYYTDENGDLQINETEASVVRLVFDMYLQGQSVLGILRELESQGIKSPTGNDRWCKRSVDVMLRNEKYSGDVIIFKTYNTGSPNVKRKINDSNEINKYISIANHPAIVTKEIFSAVNMERLSRSNITKDENGSKRKSTRYSSKRDITM